MRDLRRHLAALAVAGLLAAAPAHAALPAETSVNEACRATQPLFAGGGTAVTNGFFFPGTAFYDGKRFVGTPYVISKGCDVRFVNLDPAVVTNIHQIRSLKRKRGVPLFSSKAVAGPGEAIVKTSHLRPGVYPYYCTIHYGMFGLLEVRAL